MDNEASVIGQLGSKSERQSEQAVRQRCRKTAQRKQKHTQEASVKQSAAVTKTQVWMWEAERAVVRTQAGISISDVVGSGRGVSPQGASDPPWRWSVNANFNAASPEQSDVALL